MSITIAEMNQKVAKIAVLRAREEEASRAKKEITAELELAEREMIEMLQTSELTNFTAPDGKVILAFRTSVKTPKAPEDRAAFEAWLATQGLTHLLQINSQTLNSLYKDGLEEAKARGDADFVIPGINEVTYQPQLRFNRA